MILSSVIHRGSVHCQSSTDMTALWTSTSPGRSTRMIWDFSSELNQECCAHKQSVIIEWSTMERSVIGVEKSES